MKMAWLGFRYYTFLHKCSSFVCIPVYMGSPNWLNFNFIKLTIKIVMFCEQGFKICASITCFYMYINSQDIYKNVMFQTYRKFQNWPQDGAKQVVAHQVTRMLCNADLEIRTLDFESQFWITCCFKVHFL